MVCLAVITIFLRRSIDAEPLVSLILGTNIAFLLLRRSAIAAVTPEADSASEPRIEGWLAATAALVTFGALWFAILLPLTLAIWHWYWGLNGGAKLVLFIMFGSYFAGLVWLTLVVPFTVAGYFFNIAVQDADRRVAV